MPGGRRRWSRLAMVLATMALSLAFYWPVYWVAAPVLEASRAVQAAVFAAAFTLASITVSVLARGRAALQPVDELVEHVDMVSANRAIKAFMVAGPLLIIGIAASAGTGVVEASSRLVGFLEGFFAALMMIAVVFVVAAVAQYRRLGVAPSKLEEG